MVLRAALAGIRRLEGGGGGVSRGGMGVSIGLPRWFMRYLAKRALTEHPEEVEIRGRDCLAGAEIDVFDLDLVACTDGGGSGG